MQINQTIAKEFNIKQAQVNDTVALIDEGNTIPFIARYRKEATGGLTDVVLRDMETRLTYLRNLEERKEEVIRLIEEQEKLTPKLKEEIQAAEVLQRVEDLYKPFKQKRATRATKAKEKGLEPLADIIFEQQPDALGEGAKPLEDLAAEFIDKNKGVETVEEALAGASDIIAERISDDADINEKIRDYTRSHGAFASVATDKDAETVYETYYDFSEPISKIANHRILAMNRGEKEGALKLKFELDKDNAESLIARKVIKSGTAKAAKAGSEAFARFLEEAIADAYKRLMAPSIERDIRNELTERAEAEAVKIFALNTKKLLMARPVAGARIISIDPGYRTGCKVAVLSETGKLLAYTTIYPTKPREDIAGAKATLKKLTDKYNINTIVVGNGTASRETEEVAADFIRQSAPGVKYTIVNEAGASVYSASKLATEEYPDLDVTTRGAMSLGRRLQDPLAELVKIDPKSIGVGQYQHDINQKMLEGALTNVVEDCVNSVGVDLNTASASLLSYVAGINMAIAKNIVAYREETGKFTGRKQLLKVPKLGPKAFTQCAGFCRIVGGKEPLDGTAVHPESYEAAKLILEKLGIAESELAKGGVADIRERAKALAASDIGIGKETFNDILDELHKPARDPRDDAPEVVFRNDVRSFEDLKEGMEMTGTVRNVVDFGAFVDIGVKNDGLVHISQLSDKYVKHPMDVVAVGDVVKVRIISIDAAKHRVGLTMKLETSND